MITNKQDKLRLKQQCLNLGLHFEFVEEQLNDTVVDSMGGESWDELDMGQPGDIKKSPCIVHCYNSNQPGSATRRSYSYIV